MYLKWGMWTLWGEISTYLIYLFTWLLTLITFKCTLQVTQISLIQSSSFFLIEKSRKMSHGTMFNEKVGSCNHCILKTFYWLPRLLIIFWPSNEKCSQRGFTSSQSLTTHITPSVHPLMEGLFPTQYLVGIQWKD